MIAVFQNKEDENDDEQGLRGDDGEGNLAWLQEWESVGKLHEVGVCART